MGSCWCVFPTNHPRSGILGAKGADDQNEKIANQKAATGENPLRRLAMARITGRTTDQKGKNMENEKYRQEAHRMLQSIKSGQTLKLLRNIIYEYWLRE